MTDNQSRSRSNRGPSRFGYPLIIGGILAVGIIFVFISTASGGQYALELGQVAATPARYDGKRVRIVGHIKHGSTQELVTAGQPELHFAIIDEQGHEVAVVYQQSRPDAYEEGRSCIVEGTLTEGGMRLDAQKLTVKCPSKYQTEDGLVDKPPAYYREKYGTGSSS